ncbi:MAG: hypothetical protein ACK56I_25300, partial [bacterium]
LRERAVHEAAGVVRAGRRVHRERDAAGVEIGAGRATADGLPRGLQEKALRAADVEDVVVCGRLADLLDGDEAVAVDEAAHPGGVEGAHVDGAGAARVGLRVVEAEALRRGARAGHHEGAAGTAGDRE